MCLRRERKGGERGVWVLPLQMSFSKITSLSCSSSSLPSLSLFSYSLFLSLCFWQYPQPWADRERENKIFKNNHNKNSRPVNRRKRALAGAWRKRKGRYRRQQGRILVQQHLRHRRRWRKKRKVAQKRCFVSAFHAKSLGLEGSEAQRPQR